MAWLTKNSGTMAVERRAEPYLDAAMQAALERDVPPRYPTRRAATLPVLHAIQERHNFLPPQALEEAAAFLRLEPSEVLDTASFYEMYFLQPRGRHTVWVCQSISCELMGHERLMEHLEAKLGIG